MSKNLEDDLLHAVDDLKHSQEKRKQLKLLVQSMQTQQANAQWFVVEIKCRMHDIKHLCDGVLRNSDPKDVEQGLLYKENED